MAEILSHPAPPPPETPLDAGSQALSEALRSSFGIVKFVMALLFCVFLGSGFFTVGPQEQAIIIRLGKPVGEGRKALLGPGLHWSFPYPIDEYKKVPIASIQTVKSTIGWYATTPEAELAGTEIPSLPVGTPMNPLADGYVLTADKNILHARATLTYHIADPVGYVFHFVDAAGTVQRALDNALLLTAAQFNVDDILTRDRAGFKAAVLKKTAALVEAQALGVVVEECVVDVKPPRQLKEAFDNVARALEVRGKLLNTALSEANQTTNRASADAQSIIDAAQKDRARLVKDIAGEAQRFNDLLPKYRQNPKLFVEQRLTAALSTVLANAQEKIFLATGISPKEMRLMLNRELKKNAEEKKP
jgi:modulator of FtsH protease HflK